MAVVEDNAPVGTKNPPPTHTHIPDISFIDPTLSSTPFISITTSSTLFISSLHSSRAQLAVAIIPALLERNRTHTTPFGYSYTPSPFPVQVNTNSLDVFFRAELELELVALTSFLPFPAPNFHPFAPSIFGFHTFNLLPPSS